MQKRVRITKLTKARVSANGNPRWYVHLSDGTQYYTQPDAAVAYGLDNPEMKGDLMVTIEHGQIIYAEPAGPIYCQRCAESGVGVCDDHL